MTLALACYSGVFMRYAMAVTPANYLLFGCHVVNFSAQVTQGYRFLNYWKYVYNQVPSAQIYDGRETRANVSLQFRRQRSIP
jgi:hypothetical protein